MNKDTVVASVIGFSLGLIAAVSLWVVPRILPKQLSKSITKQESEAPKNTAAENKTGFEVSMPKDGDIVKSSTVNLTGQAIGADFVVITSVNSTAVTQPSPEGNFATDLALKEGVNQIAVAMIQAGQQTVRELSVYYLGEDL